MHLGRKPASMTVPHTPSLLLLKSASVIEASMVICNDRLSTPPKVNFDNVLFVSLVLPSY
jgi:hypothetical protein